MSCGPFFCLANSFTFSKTQLRSYSLSKWLVCSLGNSLQHRGHGEISTPVSRNLGSVYRILTVFNHVYHPDGFNNTLPSQSYVRDTAASMGIVDWPHLQLQERGWASSDGRGPVHRSTGSCLLCMTFSNTNFPWHPALRLGHPSNPLVPLLISCGLTLPMLVSVVFSPNRLWVPWEPRLALEMFAFSVCTCHTASHTVWAHNCRL